MHPFTPMSAAAQTAFANLQGPALQADLHRSVATLPGGFSTKTIRDRVYWYYQYKTEGKLVQIYVGPDSDPAVQELIARRKAPQPGQAGAAAHLRRLPRAAIELGCVAMPPAHAKVLKRLGDHRFFRAGGILIGTHAFLAYQNMLGVHWDAGTATMDIDFAHPGRNIAIALPGDLRIDTHKAIESLQMGFLPNASNTTYTKEDEKDFQIDFVTSQGRIDAPQHIESLNVTLQPLKFMEFSMEDVQQTAVLSPDGPIVVNCPAPERFALHKLLVAGERQAEFANKASKDIDQAHCLIACLVDARPGLLEDACADLVSRGKGWRSRFTGGLAILRRRYRDTDVSLLTDVLESTKEPAQVDPGAAGTCLDADAGDRSGA
jgi:hypothetical protein